MDSSSLGGPGRSIVRPNRTTPADAALAPTAPTAEKDHLMTSDAGAQHAGAPHALSATITHTSLTNRAASSLGFPP